MSFPHFKYNITAHKRVGTAGYKQAGAAFEPRREGCFHRSSLSIQTQPSLFSFFFFFCWRKQNILNPFFPDTIGMFGCEPCCSKPYSPMLCGKPSACKHRLGTGSPHCGHMAARIYHRLETVQSCRQRGFANQSPAWLKDVTH